MYVCICEAWKDEQINKLIKSRLINELINELIKQSAELINKLIKSRFDQRVDQTMGSNYELFKSSFQSRALDLIKLLINPRLDQLTD